MILCLFSERGLSDVVKNGRILVERHALESSAIALKGQWKFFHQQFIAPEQVNQLNQSFQFVAVPGAWNDVVEKTGFDGEPGYTYGTYVLEFAVTNDVKSATLELNHVTSSYRLYLIDNC